ncbi:LuxR C-terminal-related transcriptional regulator [Micromonospora haikouensis]|uniref:response regulator transcription factor n=1 Tax=Micromonospora haikouensis TaxID=686309 RepID=UPI003D9007D7
MFTSQDRLAPPQVRARAHTATSRTPVVVVASDVISCAGVVSQLRPRPEVLLLDYAEADRAEVAVIIADGIDEATLRTLRALRARGTSALVLVVTQVDDIGLVAAVEHGVAGIIRRAETTADRLIAVIRAADAGEGTIPPDLLGRLLQQVGTVQREVLGPRGLTFTGLTDREVEVLRLVADGFDTAQIADKLCYSQRTIKNILSNLMNRMHLRNRCHAVAYALRNGLI